MENSSASSPLKPLRIRSFSARDFPVLLDLDQRCFEPAIAYDAEEMAWYLSDPDSLTLIAECGDRISGFLVASVNKKRATLITLDVDSSQRRRGVGSALIRTSEPELRRRGALVYELQVDVANTSAIAFYEHHCFRRRRRLPDYYPTGASAYLMERRLTGLPNGT
jgi:ribosomal protein S18 acetylase RimI-like enzyme